MFFEAVGWRVFEIPQNYLNKILRDKESYTIAELRNNDKVYIIKDFPCLSKQEHMLLEQVFEELLQTKTNPNTISVKYFISKFCEKSLIEIETDQLNYLSRVLESSINGFGVLENLLSNQNIEEIAITGCGKKHPIFVYEKNFGWLSTNSFFQRKENVINLANKMAMKIGRQLGHQTPLLNAFLPDGSRLNACIPPVSEEPTITIRKFSKQPFTPLDLLNKKTISSQALAFLWLAMKTDLSAIISGNTGSGKTTTLNSLFSFVPKNERIIVSEETPEIRLLHSHVARLRTVEQIGILMNDIVTNTLRMRPDRVIVGEMRTLEETSAFVNTILAGQGKGSIATFHAQSAFETIQRLKKLGAQDTELLALDLIIVQKRWDKTSIKKGSRKEVRKITEIAEVRQTESGIEPLVLFGFNYKKNRLELKNEGQRVIGKISRSFGESKKAIFREMNSRAEFLEKKARQTLSPEEFFEVINNEFA